MTKHQCLSTWVLLMYTRLTYNTSFYSGRSFAPILPLLTSMNSLVQQYSRPSFQDEGYSREDQEDLSALPTLSLKFALPPVANVCYFPWPIYSVWLRSAY